MRRSGTRRHSPANLDRLLERSVTDLEARLWRKSQTAEARLSSLRHVLGENRQGLIVNVRVWNACGRAKQGLFVGAKRQPGAVVRRSEAVEPAADELRRQTGRWQIPFGHKITAVTL